VPHRSVYKKCLVWATLDRGQSPAMYVTTSALNSLHWLEFSNESILNWLYSCPPFAPQRWISIHVIFATSLYAIASASLCLRQYPLSTSYQHYSCVLWFSTCWPFPLEFSSSSSQIFRFLTVFKSNLKTHLFSGASISGPSNFYSRASDLTYSC